MLQRLSAISGKPDSEFEEIIDRSILIGSGQSRNVYPVIGSLGFVVKEMKRPFPHANIVEWIVWGALTKMAEDYVGAKSNPEIQHLFASCHAISETGKFLVMERLFRLGESDSFHREDYPSWLNDIKPPAFGLDTAFGKDAYGKVKVMDYAEVNFYEVLNPLNCG